MSSAVRSAVAGWLREQAALLESRSDQMGELYCPRFMHDDEKPFDDRKAHLRVAHNHENAQRRSENRILRRS